MNNNLFGTDGIRAIVGTEPLNAEKLPILGHAIARWAKEKYKMHPSILLAHDTRSSCYFIKATLKSGLLLHTIKLYDVLALPTPTACILIRQNKLFDCGIIITASHNPYQYNGIKIIDSNGNKISEADELEISAYCQEAIRAPD
jgi:phosphoglucosamine mutase